MRSENHASGHEDDESMRDKRSNRKQFKRQEMSGFTMMIMCNGSADTCSHQAMLHPHGTTPVTVPFLCIVILISISLVFATTAHSLPPVVQSKTLMVPFDYLLFLFSTYIRTCKIE
jgi:hypothetical protein